MTYKLLLRAIWHLWDLGHDTHDIAMRLDVHEAHVEDVVLARILDKKRRAA